MQKIPILNIYYLLSYAWNILDEDKIKSVSKAEYTEVIDLFSLILINGCSHLLKQGLDRYYIETESQIVGIKGKFNVASSIKQNTLPVGKTICTFDEFSYDILHNQIIKATIQSLLKISGIDKKLQKELRSIYVHLPAISDITIQKNMFKNICLHKNNYHYKFILKICELIYENIFIDENTGKYVFKDFFREERAMARLFENFVRNFYKTETDYQVSSEYIKWKLESEDTTALGFIPIMKIDITIYKESEKIIIDTKYYKEAFTQHYNKEKFNTSNLYQIYAYLKNQEDKFCKGILLYPSVNGDFNYSYKIDSHELKICSINLHQDWKKIHQQLIEIIE